MPYTEQLREINSSIKKVSRNDVWTACKYLYGEKYITVNPCNIRHAKVGLINFGQVLGQVFLGQLCEKF